MNDLIKYAAARIREKMAADTRGFFSRLADDIGSAVSKTKIREYEVVHHGGPFGWSTTTVRTEKPLLEDFFLNPDKYINAVKSFVRNHPYVSTAAAAGLAGYGMGWNESFGKGLRSAHGKRVDSTFENVNKLQNVAADLAAAGKDTSGITSTIAGASKHMDKLDDSMKAWKPTRGFMDVIRSLMGRR